MLVFVLGEVEGCALGLGEEACVVAESDDDRERAYLAGIVCAERLGDSAVHVACRTLRRLTR
jgi:hypothetical protein